MEGVVVLSCLHARCFLLSLNTYMKYAYKHTFILLTYAHEQEQDEEDVEHRHQRQAERGDDFPDRPGEQRIQ